MRKLSVRRRIQAIRNFPDFFIEFGKKSQLARKLFFTNRNEHRTLKGIAGAFFGMVLGLVFYKIVISELEFSAITTAILTLIVVTLLAVGCAFSSQLRCTCLLTFPALCGRTGRSSLKALVIAYIITGPVNNLMVNTKEVIRTFTCTTVLTFNITKTKFILIFKPFKDALFSVKPDKKEVRDTLHSVGQAVAPIASEISADSEETKVAKEINDYADDLQMNSRRSERIEKKYSGKSKDKHKKVEDDYLKKLEYRCEGVMSAAGAKCRRVFEKAYMSCEEAVSWMASWALCWPMKLTFVCNIVSVLGGGDACNAGSQITPGFGKAYVYLMESKDTVSSELKPPQIQYKLTRPNIPIDVRGATDTAQAIYRDFEQKRTVVDSVLVVLKRVLTLVIVRIIINAQSYQEMYLSDITFDNQYITKYFRKIDARRRARDRLALLPLKKVERPNFIDPYSTKLAYTEKSHIVGHSVKIIVEVMTVSGLLVVERIYYELLDLVRRHGKIEYHQTGHHDLTIKIKGTGMVAKIVRSIVKRFNFKKKIDQNYTNEYCLPRPKHLKLRDYKNIYGLYIIIFLMVIFEGYVQRVRWVICAYFYPKREKKRILYSYNETLKQRKGYYKYMMKKIKSKMRDNKSLQDVSYLLLLRLKFPRLLGWLGFLEGARRKCLVCGELEPRKRGPDWLECPSCLYLYCAECWTDLGKTCHVCNPPPSEDEDSGEEPVLPADDSD